MPRVVRPGAQAAPGAEHHEHADEADASPTVRRTVGRSLGRRRSANSSVNSGTVALPIDASAEVTCCSA